MGRYLTRGMVVVADDAPGSRAALETAVAYVPKVVALAPPGAALPPDLASVVHPGRKGLSLEHAFSIAAKQGIPWVAVRRDLREPLSLLRELLEATGRCATKDVPGFAVLLTSSPARPITRILAVVDRTDGEPSGLMVLAAVGAAQATGAELDVLLLGAPGEQVDLPDRPIQMLRVTRDKDLFEQAQRRAADEGRRARWIVVEDPTDRVALALDQVASGDYDLVMDDLGAIKLGGRVGRGGRIDRAIAPDGPGGIARALLEQTDVPLAIVLDAVRLGVIPPAVVKGGAGAVLALGILASTAPTASASALERADTQTTVSQTVDAYDAALGQAAQLASPAAVDDAAPATATAQPALADEEGGSSAAEAEDAGEASPEQAPIEVDLSEVAPADLAPDEIAPEAAPEVDPDSVEVAEAPSSDDVQAAEEAADASADELDQATEAFEETQDRALQATEVVVDAAAGAEAAAAELESAQQAYEQTVAATEAVITDATGITGALPGGASEADLAEAEAAQAAALAAVDSATTTADEALAEYEQAAGAAAQANADLEAAAEQVTQADTAYQQDAAVASATEDAYQEAMASARVSPVRGYEVTTEYGVAGPNWSTGYHTGVDYAAPEGTEVAAAASGTVVYAQNDGGAYGNRIVIEHEDGYYTSYNHLSEIDVEVGQEVTAGDHLGEVGNTGNSFGAHLHFEVTQGGDGWSSGSFVDPAAWLDGTA